MVVRTDSTRAAQKALHWVGRLGGQWAVSMVWPSVDKSETMWVADSVDCWAQTLAGQKVDWRAARTVWKTAARTECWLAESMVVMTVQLMAARTACKWVSNWAGQKEAGWGTQMALH